MPVGIHKLLSAAVVSVCVLVGGLALESAPALAAAPEAPGPVTVESIKPSEATVHGVLNPGKEGAPGTFETGTYEFLYKASATGECEGEGKSPAPGLSLGGGKEEVAETLSGLVPDTEYAVCLHAETVEGATVGPAATFKTSSVPPTITSEFVSGVFSQSATLNAEVNSGRVPTECYFEYGTTENYGSVTEATSIGAGEGPVSVEAQVSDVLQPQTTYLFRAVARNINNETVRGGPVTFTTGSAEAFGLPDNRGYEMVSPVANADGDVYEPRATHVNDRGSYNGDNTRLPFQAAADGDAMAYAGSTSATGGSGYNGTEAGNEYLATRSPGGGWAAANIEPPSGTLYELGSYQAFSSDLSVGILGWDGASALAPGALTGGYNVLYARTNSDGSYHPLFTVTPPHRSASEFEANGVLADTGINATKGDGLAFAGASSNMEHLLFEANDALTPEAELNLGDDEGNDLYDSVDGRLFSVNVLPNGTLAPDATFGSYTLEGSEPIKYPPDFSHVISSDGSRIFWTDLSTGEIYVRENDATSHPRTVPVGGGRFWTASADGSKVFFTDNGGLYEYEVESGITTDLSVNSDPGEEVNVQGVVGVSEDGTYTYFVASDAMGDNLYLVHAGARPKFIAPLSDNDLPPLSFNEEHYGDWQPGLGNRTAEVTPDGLHLVFMSQASLTGYDSGGSTEVYVYSAEGDEGTGALFCASCSPSGARPANPLVGPGENWSAFLQPSYSKTYMHRWISAEGTRVFFDSGEALVPQDKNGLLDVYEWEQDGAGTCHHGGGYTGGCIYLLSGGTSTDNSYFADASENGDDVFIVSRAPLVAGGQGETLAVYDARVDAPRPLAPLACSGSGCQGVPAAPPIFATPASVTFSGPGNISPPGPVTVKQKTRKKGCAAGKKLSHGKCVKSKSHKRAKRANKASRDRRTSR